MSSLTSRPSKNATSSPRLSNPALSSPYSTSTDSWSSLVQQNFNATLPLAISLNPSDLPSGAADTVLAGHYTYHTVIRRNSYLTLILQEVKEGLIDLIVVNEEAKVKEEEIWFEWNGMPLRWHWPVGLLYDISMGNQATSYSDDSAAGPSNGRPSSMATTAPWTITLRIGSLPTAKLPPPSSNPILGISSEDGPFATLIEGTKQAFMAMLKEGDFIRNGNTKKVNNLRRVEQDGIWEALRSGDYHQYSSLVSKIFPTTSAYSSEMTRASSSRVPSSSTPKEEDGPSRNPLYPQSSASVQAEATSSTLSLTPSLGPNLLSATPMAEENHNNNPSASSSGGTNNKFKGQSLPNLKAIPVKFVLQGGVVLQEAIPPLVGDDGMNSMTLKTVLNGLFPALFPSPSSTTTSTDEGEEGKSSLGIDFRGGTETSDQGETTVGRRLAIPIIQGIHVPLESSIPWLAKTMSGTDGWLTIVILLLRQPIVIR